MPARDPQTGQYVSGSSGSSGYDDIEVVSFSANIGIPAADLDGTAGFAGEAATFEGLQVLDYDTVVDRNEDLTLLTANHKMSVFSNSTQSEDGAVVAAVEVSADPSLTAVTNFAANASQSDIPDSDIVDGQATQDDTIDLLGRPLVAMAGGNFSDTATGVGGAAGEGRDEVYVSMPPAEFGRFHPRDELFLNGKFRVWNVDDAGVHVSITAQHVYGVTMS